MPRTRPRSSALGVRPVVVGSSGGARVGVELARRHPDLLVAAVLSEPPIPSLAPDAGAGFLSDIGSVVKPAVATGGPRAAVDAFFSLICPGLWSTLDDEAKEPYRANADMMLAEFAGAPYQLDPADLAEITVPTLVIRGDRSHPALRAIAQRVADGLSHARLAELDGCGHVTYAERPAEFATLVTEFVAAL